MEKVFNLVSIADVRKNIQNKELKIKIIIFLISKIS